jgi:predicted porin
MFSIAEQARGGHTEEETMKKKAAALAVGALFAAPAVQAQITMGNETIGTVQIYGKLYPQFSVAKAQGSTQPGAEVSTLVSANGILGGAAVVDHGQRNAVDSQNSYLGFRGERKLGGALKAIWQIEQSVALDTGDAAWSNRNSFAGLSHGTLGTVKLGNMDTIYKEYGDTFAMFGIASGNFISASNVLSHIGIGSNNVARFHERRPSSVQYQTAEFGGFQAGMTYGPDELKGDPGRGSNANLWSFGVKYDSQMFYASLQHEIHNDFFGASRNIADATIANVTAANITAGTPGTVHSRDTATRASGEIRFSGQRIVVDFAKLTYRETGQTGNGKFQEYKKPNWAIGYQIDVGPWGGAIQYVHAGTGTCQLTGGVDCSTRGLDSKMISIGGRYRFDRQTFVYVIVNRLNNGASAQHDNWAASTPNRGEDLSQAAIGISYSF